MSHCTCSVRALELFIKQVAGVNIKRSYHTSKPIRNRKPLQPYSFARSLHTASVTVAEDAHVPFEATNGTDHLVEGHLDNTKRVEPHRKEDLADDWHAEVTITSTVPATSAADKEDEHLLSASTIEVAPPSLQPHLATVDTVDLRSLHPPTSGTNPNSSLTLVVTDSRTHRTRQPSTVSPSTELRKLRRARREAEGTYRPKAQEVQRQKSADDEAVKADQISAQPKSQTTEHDNASEGTVVDTAEPQQVMSVLDLIEGLEGPKLKPAKSKTLDPESHKAAKKLKYDEMVARKALAKEKAHAEEQALAMKRQKEREPWQIQKSALERKFGETGWSPRKRLSPDTLEGIRAIHASDPATYTTRTLSEHFKVTPEAVRRILKSKWKPNEDEVADRRVRWERRGIKKWEALASQGIKPPAKWRALGVGSETGTNPDRVPKRTLRSRFDGSSELSWDEVVADMEVPEGGVAARIL